MNFQTRSFIALVLIASCLGSGYFLVWPKWNEYNISASELNAAKERKARTEEAKKQLQTFLEGYKSQGDKVAVANSALPTKDVAMHLVLNDLDRWARQSGVVLSNTTPSDRPEALLSAPSNSIQYQEIQMNGSGAYPSLNNFITLMESNQRLFDIQELSISSSETTAATITIRSRVYYQQ